MAMGGAQRPLRRSPTAAQATAWRLAPSVPTVAAVVGFVVLGLVLAYFVPAGLVHQLTPRHVLAGGAP